MGCQHSHNLSVCRHLVRDILSCTPIHNLQLQHYSRPYNVADMVAKLCSSTFLSEEGSVVW